MNNQVICIKRRADEPNFIHIYTSYVVLNLDKQNKLCGKCEKKINAKAKQT